MDAENYNTSEQNKNGEDEEEEENRKLKPEKNNDFIYVNATKATDDSGGADGKDHQLRHVNVSAATASLGTKMDDNKDGENFGGASNFAENNAQQLAKTGNPDFIYETLYYPGTQKECPSFRCFKCPTSVDKIERLESHQLSHGASKRCQCKYCDFSVDQMYVILRHEELHRAQKQKKEAILAKERAATSVAEVSSKPLNSHVTRARTPSAASSDSTKFREPTFTSPPTPSPRSVANDDPMQEEDIEIDVDSGEEVDLDVSIESGEEMELDNDEEEQEIEEDNSVTEDDNQLLDRNSPMSRKSKSMDLSNETIPQKSPSPPAPTKRTISNYKSNKSNSWDCQHCPATFKFQSFQKRHELLHFGKRTYPCSYCTFSTGTPFSIREHVALHEAAGDTDVDRTKKSASPSPSVASSVSSTSTSRSRSTKASYQSPKRSPRSFLDAETEKLHIGNPDFNYLPVMKKVHDRVVEMPTWRCFSCPTCYLNRADLAKHLLRHGATDGYKCKLCDYAQPKKETFNKHLARHRAQGNIPEHLLTVDYTEGPKETFNMGAAYNIGDATEVAIIGNENDFEIEVEGNTFNDEEIEDISSPLPPQLSPHMPTEAEETSPNPNPRDETIHNALKPLLNLKNSKTQQKPPSSSNFAKPSKSFDIYDVDSTSIETKMDRSETYVLTAMKVNNFMCFEEISFNLNSDAVTFSGGEGKSTSIIAILLCLGYDLLIDNNTPSVICGWEISDLIRRGRDVATIEITLCLKSCASLSKEFGNEVKIRRTLRRGVPLSASTFQLTFDRESNGSVSSTSISVQRLRGILADLFIFPQYSRLLLLDKQNFKIFMNDKEYWYELFVDAVKFKGKYLKTNVEKLTPLFQRLEGDLKWRKTQLHFLEDQLVTDYPFEEDLAFLQWRNEDVKRRRQVELDLEELTKKYTKLEKLTVSYTEKLSSVPTVVLKEMRTIYLEFLSSQNCIGDILIDEKKNILRIWIKDKGALDEEIPINTIEADDVWAKTPQGKKQLGIFGLYLGFWKVNDTCPFFAVDAYSSAELEFKFPAKGLPVLMRLVRSKSGQQFLMSYPES